MPGQGAKLTRAAGTIAKVMNPPGNVQSLVRSPPVRLQVIISCSQISNPTHGARKLKKVRDKAGGSLWVGINS